MAESDESTTVQMPTVGKPGVSRAADQLPWAWRGGSGIASVPNLIRFRFGYVWCLCPVCVRVFICVCVCVGFRVCSRAAFGQERFMSSNAVQPVTIKTPGGAMPGTDSYAVDPYNGKDAVANGGRLAPGDPSRRAFAYFMMGSARFVYASVYFLVNMFGQR